MASPRRCIRRTIEWAAAHGGVAARRRRRFGHRTLVLAYHNVVPDGQPPGSDVSLHLPRARFARQLDLLQAHCSVVPLRNILRGDTPAADGRPRVAITFDDAYRGALTAGLGELAARGLPATVFVAPGALGGPFWWDEYLATQAAARRSIALSELAGAGGRIHDYAASKGWTRVEAPPHARAVTPAELSDAVSGSAFTVGSHTWSHPSLPRLGADEVADELTRPFEWLRDAFRDAWLPALAYPYGISDERVARSAAAAGYIAAFRVDGGWMPTHPTGPFALPRLNIPGGLSDDGFILRISGFFAR